jgi:hypothetical protein
MSERWSSKGGRSYPVRHGTPPPFEFFAAPRPPAGAERFALALDAVRIEIEGLDAALAAALRDRFGVYAGGVTPGPSRAPSPVLRVLFAREDRDYFIDPPEVAEFNPVWLACDGKRIRYVGHQLAGWFDTSARRGEILLTRGTYEPELRALENYLRCAVAWAAAECGGALVHGASAVRNGKGYLFYGESGAGKSTLSSVNTRARVVSDDLSLLLPRPGGGLDLVGSPFRGTYEEGEPVVGRFPLAAGFRIVKDDRAEVRPQPRAIAFGQLVGNLTFVAEAFRERPDLFASIETAFAGIPLLHLHFEKDDSYWDAIDAAGL